MKDLRAKFEKLVLEAEDCALISKLAQDPQKRAFFAKLSLNLRSMAREIEHQIATRRTDGTASLTVEETTCQKNSEQS